MMKARTLEAIGSLFATLLVTSLAYGFEIWQESVKFSFSMPELIQLDFQLVLINVILVVSLISLNWLINSKAHPNAFVSLIIFLIGTLLTIYPLLFVLAIQNPRIAQLQPPMLDQTYPSTRFSIACAFIAVIGAIGLIRKSSD